MLLKYVLVVWSALASVSNQPLRWPQRLASSGSVPEWASWRLSIRDRCGSRNS